MSGNDTNIIFRSKVKEWDAAARYIDAHNVNFSREQVATLYSQVRGMFNPGAVQLTDLRLREIQEDLREEAALHQDEFGTILRSFAGIISQIIKSRDSFRQELAAISEIPGLGGSAEDKKDRQIKNENTPVKQNRVINGDVWEGYFIGSRPTGNGMIKYANGMVYQGPWSEHGPEGRGRLMFAPPSGWFLIANFKKGKVSGALTFRWLNGDSFTTDPVVSTSSYSDIIRFASGTYRFFSGETERGRFIDGEWCPDRSEPRKIIVKKLFTPGQTAVVTVSAILIIAMLGCLIF